ncbi:hypothetical protein LINPERPRIM_LOCUS29312 [Linum perenne]
MTMR